jgi:hypothetical protein
MIYFVFSKWSPFFVFNFKVSSKFGGKKMQDSAARGKSYKYFTHIINFLKD